MNATPPWSHRRRHVRPGRGLLAFGAAATAALLITGVLIIVNGDRPLRIGYFADWNVANRDFTIRDLADSGSPERLDRLMWAFGDISEDGLCHIPGGHDQAWELYQRRYSSQESVNGEADEYEQELAGSLNQLRQLQHEHPDLRASLSLGGWNWSRYFSVAARTEESRRAFVSSCVDLWLRGNLPVREGEPQGGEGAAAGIFDGIDLDWEWPGGSGNAHNVEDPADAAGFTLLVVEFRRQLDELSEDTGRTYTLSASLPGSSSQADAYDPEIFDHLDFATVQGYDFSGPWSENTAYHSNLYPPASDPDANSADAAVTRFVDLGAPPDKLVLGVPAFGRGWQGVGGADQGPGHPARPADDAYDGPTMAFSDLEALDGERYLDEEAGAFSVRVGDQWWTYDAPDVIAIKGDYVQGRGLGGLMVWNLDMDPTGDFVRAMDEALR